MGIKLNQIKTYGVLCEDDEEELWRRQININEYMGLDMQDLTELCYVSRVGEENLLMTFDGKDAGKLTTFFNSLLDDIKDFGANLVVLDTAADLFGGNENNRSQTRQFLQSACVSECRNQKSGISAFLLIPKVLNTFSTILIIPKST